MACRCIGSLCAEAPNAGCAKTQFPTGYFCTMDDALLPEMPVPQADAFQQQTERITLRHLTRVPGY